MTVLPTLTRPGVYVDQSSFPTYANATPGTASACFIGPANRGPLTPTIVRSWREFTTNYGGFETALPPSPMHMAVFSYFSAGGTSALIVRAIRGDSSGPVTASVTLNDKSTAPGLPTLEVQAASPGAWGGVSGTAGLGLWVDIFDGTVEDTLGNVLTFTLQVKYQGTGPANVVETWQNLSMEESSTTLGQNNYALDIVNSPYTGSKYIRLVDMNSATVAPNNRPAATTASQPLKGGSDGSPLTSTDITSAVGLLDQYPDQPFVLNLPGVDPTDASTIGAVISYAEKRGDVFVVLDCPPGVPPDTMASTANSLSSSSQAAIYYPQVLVADPYSPTAGRTRTIPPGGFVVGRYITTDISRGVAKAPAGLGASLLGVYGLERLLTNDDQGLLTQANVNCLISIPGSGVVIWGSRTLSPYLITRYVPVERTLIYLKTQLVALSRFAVFEPNNWMLWNQVNSVLGQFLTSFWQSGGLSGQNVSQAYYVICDSTNNTPQTIQQGIVNIEVGVSLQFPAEFVVIQIGQWAGGSSVSITTS